MKYLLDTNICSAWLRGKDPSLRERILGHSPEDLSLCSVVKAELSYGALRSPQRHKLERILGVIFSQIRSVPFDDECVATYARLRVLLEGAGVTLGAHDLMIAATAERHGMTVVTRDSAFQRVAGLKTEVW